MSEVQKKQTNLREKLAELLDFKKMRDRLSGLGLYIGKDRTNTDENLLVRGGANVDDLQLAEISAVVGGTAVDVFVYDTSRDSDGGKWRERTQHTSWYNEELNTATRGARREFPVVAVIVAEADKVTIYDGDDPDMGMWMVFEVDFSPEFNILASGSDLVLSVEFLNGIICVGMDSGGFVSCNFISESIRYYRLIGSSFTGGYYQGVIADRNSHKGYQGNYNETALINDNVNDLAMTVLPNAPIDENTGLPVPTIAVATDGGVSVIKDDGNVVDITSGQTSFLYSYYVVFDQSNRLFLSLDGQGLKRRIWGLNNIPATDLVITTDINEKQNGDIFIADNNGYGTTTKDMFLFNQSNSQAEGFASDNSIGTNQGLFKSFINKEDSSKSLYNYITSKYNTGWMPGDIKLAALSDSVVENVGVSSDELISNNKFGTGTEPTGWLTHLGTSTIVNNQAVLDGSGVTDANLITEINCVVGKMYEFNIDSFRSAGSNTYDISVSTGSGSLFHQSVIKGVNKNNTSIETTTIRFVATQATHYVGVKCNGSPSNAVITIDNAYARQITELITNGDFSTDSDWEKGTGWSISGGVASCDGTNYATLIQDNVFSVFGVKYVITFTVSSYTSGDIEARWYDTDWRTIGSAVSGDGTYTFTFTLGENSNGALTFRSGSFDGSIDNISVRPAEEDRSVNDNGLQIVGEINKTPVAPGADLVAYSGFSANNYLVQPYNADLDFGTGDFCIMGWFKQSPTTDFHTYLSRGGRISVYVDANTSTFNFRVTDGSKHMNCLSTSVIDNDTWTFFVGVKSDGTTYNYINGKLERTANYQTVGSLDGEFTTHIGVNHDVSTDRRPAGEMTLWRISATVPTAEQIAKIYRDEKVLFTEGAQATLYGTSDAVTALAYDQKTELLHVGTASGRSDFSGLRRINNTTTVITTSISAHNNLIAEQ